MVGNLFARGKRSLSEFESDLKPPLAGSGSSNQMLYQVNLRDCQVAGPACWTSWQTQLNFGSKACNPSNLGNFIDLRDVFRVVDKDRILSGGDLVVSRMPYLVTVSGIAGHIPWICLAKSGQEHVGFIDVAGRHNLFYLLCRCSAWESGAAFKIITITLDVSWPVIRCKLG